MGGLMLAAGGGGDVISASLLSRLLGIQPPAPVLTYSWDRLLVDPLPGPRFADNFEGLTQLAPNVLEVTPTTRPVPPAGSSLPRLSAELPIRALLLDPAEGAVGMARQIRAACEHFAAGHLYILDVGGDILTTGSDPGLRSPLADQLALAAAAGSGVPSSVLLAGAGLDGEIEASVLEERISQLDGHVLAPLGQADVAPTRSVFRWHPSEASGIFSAAAAGLRGRVQVRDAGDILAMTDRTADVYQLSLEAMMGFTPAAKLVNTNSLAEAEATTHELTGLSEITYEQRKAQSKNQQTSKHPTLDILANVDRQAAIADAAGADYLSVRRLAELVGIRSLEDYESFGNLLATHRPDRYRVSIYRTD